MLGVVMLSVVNAEFRVYGNGSLQMLDLVEKFFPRTNALAYFSEASVTKEKSFISTTPGANVIKLFSSVIYGFS